MDKSIYTLVINLILSLQCCCSNEWGLLQLYEICSPEGFICLEQRKCSQLHEAIQNGFQPRLCSYIGREPVICCVDPPSPNKEDEKDKMENIGENERISAKECENYYHDVCPMGIPLIQNGEPAEPKELPFMALIGYGLARNIKWRCAGTLISPRYVLSAAHCSEINPWIVRLGELNFATFLDDAKPQDFKIAHIYDHPNYKRSQGYDDITLYQLDKDAVINEYVRPICLNQQPILIEDAQPVVAAGWGDTKYGGKQSRTLLKVGLELFDPNGCYREEYARKLPYGVDSESTLCAGSREGGKDTCSGDSGGPLFYKPSVEQVKSGCFLYTQVGITSMGYQCGLKDYPALYTNVYYYLPWIESIVWPSNKTNSRTIWNK